MSDDFSAGLDASRWSVVDPLGGASVGVVDGILEIGVPGGVRHNPWLPNEAPRVLQPVADADADVGVRFDSVQLARRDNTTDPVCNGDPWVWTGDSDEPATD